MLAVALVFAALSACDKVALLAPTDSTIALSISTTVVPINGSADIIATVIEKAGTPVQNGTVVTFTSTFGRVEPSEARTEGGKAIAKFIGTQSGKATINAYSGAAKAEVKDILVGGAAAATAAMRSEPSSLPQGGGTVQVFAVVRDASGNLLPGAPVAFTSDQGSLASNSAITDANGQAQSALTTNRDTVVTVTVIAGITATTTVRIINAPTVTISATTTTPAVGVGANFTITPGTSSSNNTPIQSASVNFGDGTSVVNLGAISGATNLTHAFSQAGSYTVTASVVDATGQGSSSTISVTVQRIAPTVTLTPAASTITVGGALAFAVTATSGTGGPPVQNVQVTMNPGGVLLYSGTGSGGFTRQFNSAGTYALTATASDSVGSIGSAAAVVTVSGRATIAMTLDANATTGAAATCVPVATYPKTCTAPGFVAGTRINFSAGAIANATGYSWSFGDGQNTTTSSPNVDHPFSGAGTYTVTVSVTTTDGSTGSQVVTVIVS